MTVVQIIPTLDAGGAEKQLVLLAAEMRRRGWDIQVITLTRNGPLAEPLQQAGVPIHSIDKRGKIDVSAFRRLTALLRELRPQIVQTWLFAANSYGRAAALQANVPCILASERCVDHWKTVLHHWIDRWLARRTERIIVNSSGIRDFYVGHGLAAEKFTIIPNAVPPAAPSRLRREELLKQLKLPSDVKLIGAVGRLWPQKRYKDLIWATDLLKVVRDDVHLLIIGDGPERSRLERYRRLVHIEDRVHFLGHRNDVPDLLPHLACLWLASGYEGQPNSVMEAQAAGVPVVASDLPGTRELILDQQTGYLVPLGDRAAFANRTQTLLNDPELAERMGQAGKQRMLSEFSIAKMVDRYAELYESLLEEIPERSNSAE